MLRRLALSLTSVVLVVGLAVGLSLISPLRRPPAQTVSLIHATRLTCLTAGRALVLGGAPISATPLGERTSPSADGPIDEEFTGPTVLVSNDLIVGGVLSSDPNGYTPCVTALPTGVLQVLDPASTELVLVNTDANEAVVDLTLLGSDGEISAVGGRGIAIAPGVSRTVALSVLAPQGPVGVLYNTSAGRVSALVRQVEGRSAPDTLAGTPAESQVIGGIPADAQSVQLVLSNPSENRVAVTVAALGATSTYEPAPAADLSVDPLSTVVVDLGSSLGAEASALRISSAEAVGASVLFGDQGSQASVRATDPGRRLGVLAADAGSVLVTNPGVEPVTADVVAGGSLTTVELQPGTTTAVPVSATEVGPIRVEADGPVLAVARSQDGALSYPLSPTEDAEANAGVVQADPGLR